MVKQHEIYVNFAVIIIDHQCLLCSLYSIVCAYAWDCHDMKTFKRVPGEEDREKP